MTEIPNSCQCELPFIRGVIHQINNWMGGIIGNTDFALNLNDPVEIKTAAALSLELAEKTSRLLAILSDYIKAPESIVEPAGIKMIINDVNLLLDNWLKGAGIQISCATMNSDTLCADPAGFRRQLIRCIAALKDIVNERQTITIFEEINERGSCLVLAGKLRQRDDADRLMEFSRLYPEIQCTCDQGDSDSFIMELYFPAAAARVIS